MNDGYYHGFFGDIYGGSADFSLTQDASTVSQPSFFKPTGVTTSRNQPANGGGGLQNPVMLLLIGAAIYFGSKAL